MAKNDPPIGSVGLSAFAVALIFVVWPLVMGGSVALAISFGEEIEGKSAPEDANGFQWLYPNANNRNGAQACANSPLGTTVVNNPSGVNMGNATRVQMGGNFNSNEQGCYSGVDEYILKIPSSLLDQDDSITKLRFEHLRTSYSTNSNAVNNQYSMDIELKVNGESIWTEEDYIYQGTRRSITTNYYHGSIDFTHEFDGIELMNLRSEIDECGSTCNVTLTFSDITTINYVQYTSSAYYFTDGFIRIETFTTDADTEGLIMALSPWIVTILTLGVAIGSTRLFNPLAGFIGSRF